MSAISASRPGSSGARAIGARVRWNRLGRIAMLCVLAALLYLYASAGVHMLSTWRQSRHDRSAVAAMEREHLSLMQQRDALTGAGTLETEARQLGMMKSGEQPYVVSGLPRN
jgi:hypothetical protein